MYFDQDNNDFTQWMLDKEELTEELEAIREAEETINDPDEFTE